MPRSPEIHLSDSPRSRRHLDPYHAKDKDEAAGPDKLPRPGDWIAVSDGKEVPGFQVRTSTGPLWQALSKAKQPLMQVKTAKRNQEFKGLKHVTELECDLPGYDFTVLAYFKGGRRVA